jgi:hypothetical protein
VCVCVCVSVSVLETHTYNERVTTDPRELIHSRERPHGIAVAVSRTNKAKCQFMINPRSEFICRLSYP